MNTTFRIILLIVAYLICSVSMFFMDKRIYKEVKTKIYEEFIVIQITKYHIGIIFNTIISVILLLTIFPNHAFFSYRKIGCIIIFICLILLFKYVMYYEYVVKSGNFINTTLPIFLIFFIVITSLVIILVGDTKEVRKEVIGTSTQEVVPTVNPSDLEHSNYEPSIGKISSDSKDYYFFYMKDGDDIIFVKTTDVNLEIKDNNSENTEVAVITEYICTTNTEFKETSDNYQYYSTRTSYQLFLNDEQVVNVVEQ